MTRREFLQLYALSGLSTASLPVYSGNNRVLIIGAGAAGMAAAHLLSQRGMRFQILEAAPTYGGRMKQSTQFADFPVSLGAEWLHTDEKELSRIVNAHKPLDSHTYIKLPPQTQSYRTQDSYGLLTAGRLQWENLGTFEDRKFIASSWLTFFNTFIYPGIQANIKLNTSVTRINYSQDRVQVTDQRGQVYEADQVIITVPIQLLKDGDIKMTPALPMNKQKALTQAKIWGGIKIFMAFSEKFYPTYLEFADNHDSQGQRAYYDAAYAQQTQQAILGLFAVGEPAQAYQALTGDKQRDYLLHELDQLFQGAASRTYLKHIVQDWGKEPFIRMAYLADNAHHQTSSILAIPLDNTVYFAGEAYTRSGDWGAVHNATRSAYAAVSDILNRLHAPG